MEIHNIMYAMILSCAIDAKEDSYIVVTDIPGALLHANME